ncbi:MAG: hypothetical protein RIS52_2544 [Pseudomonadota bacterium]|jgi:glutathione S-transferase
MKLIGQFDSPFVRRVGVALDLYGLDFEHLPWSSFGDSDKFVQHNPLKRVPTLILESGEALIDSGAILGVLDERVGPERALIPEMGPARWAAFQRIALITGAADKAVSFFYAKLFSTGLDADFVARSEGQIIAAVTALERACAERKRAWWFGEMPGHDDIAIACVVRFLSEAYAPLFQWDHFPALADHSKRAEALPAFIRRKQAFVPPQ